MNRPLGLTVAVALLAGAVPASAAAAWGAAQPVPGLPANTPSPAVAVDAAGRADVLAVSAGQVVRVATSAPGGRGWRLVRSLARRRAADLVAPRVVTARSGAQFAAWVRRGTLRVAVRPAGSAGFRAPQVLGGSVAAWDLAVGADGDVAVAWSTTAATLLAVRPVGSVAFGPAETVAPAQSSGVHVAVSHGGEVVIAWKGAAPAPSGVAARPPGTGPVGAPEAAPGLFDEVAIAADAADAVTIAFNDFGALRATTRPRAGSLGAAQDIQRVNTDSLDEFLHEPGLFVTRSGAAAATYKYVAHGGFREYRVRVRPAPGAAWGAQRTIFGDIGEPDDTIDDVDAVLGLGRGELVGIATDFDGAPWGLSLPVAGKRGAATARLGRTPSTGLELGVGPGGRAVALWRACTREARGCREIVFASIRPAR